MSAEENGRRLLEEVEVAGMDQLLRQLHSMHQVERDEELGIPDIDRLLASVPKLYATSTTPSRQASTQANARPPDRRAPVIELTSLSPGAGKTHLLYLITSLAVLPALGVEKDLYSRKGTVLVIDADNRFEIVRLAETMTDLLRSSPAKATSASFDQGRLVGTTHAEQDEHQQTVHHALGHVHIFRPQTLSSLVATIENLESYLYDLSAHLSADRALEAIILDSASAFYWQHRAEEEAARLRAVERPLVPASEESQLPQYSRLLRALRHVQQCFGCPILYTTQSTLLTKDRHPPAAPPLNRTGLGSGMRPLLPPAWSSFPSACLLLERSTVPQFAFGMSAEDAWAERDMRWAVVKRGEFSARLVSPGGASNRGFGFYIDGDGIRIRRDARPEEPSEQP